MKKLSKSQIHGELLQARQLSAGGDVAGALKRVDAVLRSNPDSFEAHFGRASLLLALGRKSDAFGSFQQVLRYDPNNREALFFGAQTGIDIGRSSEAESLAVRLTKFEPQNDRAFFLLSIAQSQSNKWFDAARSMDAAVTLNPTDLNYLIGKAQLLAKLHLYSLSIETYRKALAIEDVPQAKRELAEVLLEEGRAEESLYLLQEYSAEASVDASTHILLGRAYSEVGRPEQAEVHWATAKASSTNDSDYLFLRSKHAVGSGNIELAKNLLREGLENDPRDIQLFALLSTIVTFSESDSDQIGMMESEMSRGQHSAFTRQVLAYALGKSHHDLGDFGAAMSFFDLANLLREELTPNGLEFDHAEWTARIDLQIRSFTPERISTLAQTGLESDLPIFVVGMIRSGTTLTQQILSGHSKIAAGGEISYWIDHRDEVANPLGGDFDPQKAKRLGREYLKSLESSRNGKRFVVDKNPLNVLITPTLSCIFPRSHFIHVKRHAIDNLLSMWMTPLTYGLQFITKREELVFAYREYLRLVTHLEDVMPQESFRTFAYEDIAVAPEPTIGKMLAFLGLDMEEACLHPENNARTVRTPSMVQVRAAINTDSIARWRQYEPWLGPFAELHELGSRSKI